MNPRITCCCLGGITSLLCLAAAPASASDGSLDEVVVVATRLPVPATKVGNTVEVIDQREIEASQAIVVSDLLASQPGIGVTRSGGPGALTALRIRGAEGDHTLVLIDGVQINDPASTGGGFDFGNLMVGDISRIEVLRGAQSTLYGSQAIGGVINIVTAEGGETAGGSVQAEYGSLDSTLLKAAFGGRAGSATGRLAGSWYRTDGISTFGAGNERDAFRNTSLAGRMGYELGPAARIDVRGYYARSRVETDGYPPPNYVFADAGDYADKRQFVGYAGIELGSPGSSLRHRLAFQATHTDRDEYSGAFGAVSSFGRYRGENERAEYQGSWQVAPGYSAVFGLQHERSRMHNDIDPLSADARLDSAYLQLQAEPVRGLTLTGGYRRDDHDSFGTHGSLQFAAAWQAGPDTVLRASWGQGFKAPTLYQLYSGYGNPGLAPETARSWDAGIEQHWQDGRLRLSAVYFERTTRQLISFLDCPDPGNTLCSAPGHQPFGYYDNTALARANGVELKSVVMISPMLDLSANYTHARSRDRSPGSASFGMQLLRRPKDVANAAVNVHPVAGLTATAALRHVSSSPENDFDVFPPARISLRPYTLVDLRIAWQRNEQWQVAGRIENLFDRRYETVHLYGAPGRAAYLSVNRRF
ncbi:MAG: TonB-dependent receptor [Steroidobacteraceae bacterium]